MRSLLAGHRDLVAKLTELEAAVNRHDESIGTLFEAIQALIPLSIGA